MQLTRWQPRTESLQLTVPVTVGIVIASIALALYASLQVPDTATLPAQTGTLYDLKYPDRALTFLAATSSDHDSNDDHHGPPSPSGNSGIRDNRLKPQDQPGSDAALGAVFPVTGGGLDVYSIVGGTGQYAYRISQQELDSAKQRAKQSGFPELIVVPPYTAEEMVTINPHVFALPSGQCRMVTLFPDGKVAAFDYAC